MSFSDIIHQVQTDFEAISLKEMDDVKLMDRADEKYIFRIEQLPFLLDRLRGHYKVLEIEGQRASRYETLYYDTDSLDLYIKHLTKRTNRYKIRSRNYVESNLCFFEVKLKNSKGRTIKTRIKTSHVFEQLSDDQRLSMFLHQETGFESARMKAQFWINYHRITLVNIASKERCTIDLNLQCVNQNYDQQFPTLVILEVKQNKSEVSVAKSCMKEMRIKKGGMSKYCLGLISLNPTVRANNFKKKIHKLNKITNAHLVN